MATLQEEAAMRGERYGRDMASRQANRLRSLTGLTSFFTGKELEMNANRSARSEAFDNRILDANYVAWRDVFVPAYVKAYRAYVAKWEAKHAEKQSA